MINKIKNDMKEAMKNKEKVKLSTLRMLLSTLENERIKLQVEELSNDDVITCINRNLKQLEQEIESLVNASRSIDSQLEQKQVLVSYLPEQLTEDEIRKEVAHAVNLVAKGEIKNPMQYLSQKLKGKADMKLVSQIVKEQK
jgi:uncharacterized protein